ncbi:MAG TPA: peptidoglycan DD-metalloendopeptidase family protein [Symbiobacteriaceae bacterium]
MRWVVIPLIALSLMTQAAPPAHAEGTDLLKEYNQQQDKLKWLREQKAKADNDLQRVNIEVLEAQAQLDKVTQEVVEADSQLTLIKSQRAAAQDQYTKIQADLQKTQAQFDKKKATLAKRVRSISEDGRVTYLAVLFGAASFSDFINRFEMLKLVVKRDAELFTSVRKDKQVLEDKKVAALKRKNELDVLEAQAKDRFNVAEAKRTEKAQVSRSLDMNKRALAAQLDQLDQQEQATRDQLEALMLSMNRPAGSFSPIWPVHGRITITDPFGPRMHPILGVARWHYGTDIAADLGQAVYAIEDGVVVQAGWDDAYGNLVVIDHGGGNSSWYGHSSVLLVRKGDQVKRGQQITKAGSTGWSTGPHVHLEIHIAGKPVDPVTLLPKQ